MKWFRKNTYLTSDIIKTKGHSTITPDMIIEYLDLEKKLVRNRFHNNIQSYDNNNNNSNNQSNSNSNNNSIPNINKRMNSRIKQEATWIAVLIIKSLNNYLNSYAKDVSDQHLAYQFRSNFTEWTTKLDQAATKFNIPYTTSARTYYENINFKQYITAIYEAG